VGKGGSTPLHYIAQAVHQSVFYNGKRVEVQKYAGALEEREEQSEALIQAINEQDSRVDDTASFSRTASLLQEEKIHMRPGYAEALSCMFSKKLAAYQKNMTAMMKEPHLYEDAVIKQAIHLCTQGMELYPDDVSHSTLAIGLKQVLQAKGQQTVKCDLVSTAVCLAAAPLDKHLASSFRAKLELAGSIDLKDQSEQISNAYEGVMKALCDPVTYPVSDLQAEVMMGYVSITKQSGLIAQSKALEVKLLERQLVRAHVQFKALGNNSEERVKKDTGEHFFAGLRLAHCKFLGRFESLTQEGASLQFLDDGIVKAAADEIQSAKEEHLAIADLNLTALGAELARNVCAKADFSRGWGEAAKTYEDVAKEITEKLAVAANNTLKAKIKVFKQVAG